MQNFNAWLDQKLAAPPPSPTPPAAAAPPAKRKPVRMRAADGVLLAHDAMSLNEAIGDGEITHAPRDDRPVSYDSPPKGCTS